MFDALCARGGVGRAEGGPARREGQNFGIDRTTSRCGPSDCHQLRSTPVTLCICMHDALIPSHSPGWKELNIAVFEWRLDDWIILNPLRGSAKEWLKVQSQSLQTGLRAVANSIRKFKSRHAGVPVMLMTDLFSEPSSEIKTQVAKWAEGSLLVSACSNSLIRMQWR